MNQYFLPHYILNYNLIRISMEKKMTVYSDFVYLGAAPIIPLQNSGWSERESLCARDSLARDSYSDL